VGNTIEKLTDIHTHFKRVFPAKEKIGLHTDYAQISLTGRASSVPSNFITQNFNIIT
jgi:hypothetical protein